MILLLAVVCVGCGGSEKKEPELRSEKVVTPGEAANELFVEAVELVSEAQSKETTDISAAIESYEQTLVKVRKIVNEYKKSDIAVKLVSGETLFAGKSMAQIEEKVNELQRELTRRAEGKRRAEELRKARAKLLRWEFITGDAVRSSPAIGSDGTVYVGSYDKKLYAINGKSGVKLWEFKTGDVVYSSPAIGSDGTIYVGSDKLYAIKTDSKGLAKSPWPMRGQNARHTGRVMKKK